MRNNFSIIYSEKGTCPLFQDALKFGGNNLVHI